MSVDGRDKAFDAAIRERDEARLEVCECADMAKATLTKLREMGGAP